MNRSNFQEQNFHLGCYLVLRSFLDLFRQNCSVVGCHLPTSYSLCFHFENSRRHKPFSVKNLPFHMQMIVDLNLCYLYGQIRSYECCFWLTRHVKAKTFMVVYLSCFAAGKKKIDSRFDFEYFGLVEEFWELEKK